MQVWLVTKKICYKANMSGKQFSLLSSSMALAPGIKSRVSLAFSTMEKSLLVNGAIQNIWSHGLCYAKQRFLLSNYFSKQLFQQAIISASNYFSKQ